MEQRSQHFKQNLISILEYILALLIILEYFTIYRYLWLTYLIIAKGLSNLNVIRSPRRLISNVNLLEK